MIRRGILALYPALSANLKLKWPNDLILYDMKLGGILTEHLPFYKYHLIGIGINSNVDVFPQDLHSIAISLSSTLESHIDNNALLTSIFDQFAGNLPDFIRDGLDPFQQEFNTNSWMRDRSIVLTTPFSSLEGVAMGINREGALLLKMEDEMILPIYSGNISHVRPTAEPEKND